MRPLIMDAGGALPDVRVMVYPPRDAIPVESTPVRSALLPSCRAAVTVHRTATRKAEAGTNMKGLITGLAPVGLARFRNFDAANHKSQSGHA